MSNRAAVGLLAAALFVGVLIAGFVPVSANGVACGSAFQAGDRIALVAARYRDDLEGVGGTDYVADCDARRGTQRAFVIPLLIVSALGGGFLLLTARKDEVDQSPRAV